MSFSGIIRLGRAISRHAGIIPVLAGLLLLPGCWVESINALYEEWSVDHPVEDHDVVFDPSLTGSWSAIDEKCTTVLAISAKDNIYDLRSTEQGEGCIESGKTLRKQARLVKLDTYYFLDVSPTPGDVCDMCLATHAILQMRIEQGSLSFTPIDSDWLKKALAAKTVALATLPNDTDMLTASSADLKSFCRRFAGDKAVFKPDSTVSFKRN